MCCHVLFDYNTDDLLQAYWRTLWLTCNGSQWQVIHTESHLKHRPGQGNRWANELRGCDTEPATQQQSCQVPLGGKRRSERVDRARLSSKRAIDHLDRGQLDGQRHSRKLLNGVLLSVHTSTSFITAGHSLYIPKLHTDWVTAACCNSSREPGSELYCTVLRYLAE